ncbi:MAG: hypothetical protein HC926_01435 [Synechococcaceae cyanobacterium SM2_3_60]|nr:hypothetical protein [Synechococcaceae cyanobacterium SM2_3_60]
MGAAGRLRFIEITNTVEEHRGQLAAVDLVLDTFPYTGATTTMEALSFNTPVLTKVGQHYYGRMSYSLLKNCDLDNCIAFTVEDYIAQGITLARNPEVLRTLKAQLQTSKFWSLCFEPPSKYAQLRARKSAGCCVDPIMKI